MARQTLNWPRRIAKLPYHLDLESDCFSIAWVKKHLAAGSVLPLSSCVIGVSIKRSRKAVVAFTIASRIIFLVSLEQI